MIHLGDIKKINGADVPIVDVICGGSPCQDLSVAGKRAGLVGERSGLFMDQIRIIKEMREHDRAIKGADVDRRSIRPRYMVWENVPGAFSSNKGEDFRAVLEETAKVICENAVIPRPSGGKWSPSGCIMGDGWSIAWRVHDAQFWGVPQRRKRISLVADFGGETAPEILFERKGVFGDIEESGEEREGAATNVRSGIEETGGAISFQERAGKPGGGKGILIQNEHVGCLSTLNNQSVVYGISAYESNAMKSGNPNSGIYKAETARTLDLNGGSPACNQGGMAVVQGADMYNGSLTGDIAATLNAASGGSAGHSGPSVVCLEGNGSRPSHCGDGYSESETMYTLNSTEHHAVAVENHPADSRVKIAEDGIVQTLSSRMGTGGGNVPMVMEQPVTASKASYFMKQHDDGVAETLVATDYKDPQLVAYGLDRVSFNQGINAQYDFAVDEEKIGTQVAKGPGAVCQSVVRRLTPMECERLQNFPDHWTDIGEWIDSKGKKHKDADSPRYKALGNSIALPFWQWMAKRMRTYLGDNPTMASLFDGISGFCLVFARAGVKPVFSSEIEEFPIAVAKKHFGDDEKGIKGDYEKYL